MVAGGYEDYDDGDILTFVYDDDDFLDPAESFPVDANPKLAAMSSEDSQYQKVYRYGFDESVLNDGAKKSLTELADSLLVSPAQRVKVEGHTCEMGSREYNIALGWRRANSVKNFLISQGVLASQIEVISYGQEKPVDLGHSEKSRHKNRRAQIKFIHEKT
tara:strand:- start:205 stop:687 length:483 start_codon:yes stop_codon:yes gene_type:complete